MIINPTPVTAATFDGMWVTNLGLYFPVTELPHSFLSARLSQYDGTNLLSTGGKYLNLPNLAASRAADAVLEASISDLLAECQLLAASESPVSMLLVSAPDPTKPVWARIVFVDKEFHDIHDCYALAATDPVFATVFQNTLEEIARLSGLTVS